MLQKQKIQSEILRFCYKQKKAQLTYRKPPLITIGGFEKFRFCVVSRTKIVSILELSLK